MREVGELEGLVRARRTRKLPVVLTVEEVRACCPVGRCRSSSATGAWRPRWSTPISSIVAAGA